MVREADAKVEAVLEALRSRAGEWVSAEAFCSRTDADAATLGSAIKEPVSYTHLRAHET